MRFVRSLAVVFLVFFAATFFGGRAQAQQVPGPHPAYLHALSDLRLARAYLDQLGPNGRVDDREARAIEQIDAAIGEIKRASIDDGKDLRDHQPIDAHLARTDRFHNAERLLGKAHNDLSRAEDVPSSRGLRDRALDHIDRAWHNTQEALNSALQ